MSLSTTTTAAASAADATEVGQNPGSAAATAKATEAFLSLLVAGQLPVMDFLEDPMDALKLMYVSKATRKVAARKLVELQQDPATKWKQQCFDQWLANPSLGNTPEPSGAYAAMTTAPHGLCGPLNLETIKYHDAHSCMRFVILNYQRTYHTEKCLLAVFDNEGELFCVYCFTKCDSAMPDPMSFHAFVRRGIYWKYSF